MTSSTHKFELSHMLEHQQGPQEQAQDQINETFQSEEVFGGPEDRPSERNDSLLEVPQRRDSPPLVDAAEPPRSDYISTLEHGNGMASTRDSADTIPTPDDSTSLTLDDVDSTTLMKYNSLGLDFSHMLGHQQGLQEQVQAQSNKAFQSEEVFRGLEDRPSERNDFLLEVLKRRDSPPLVDAAECPRVQYRIDDISTLEHDHEMASTRDSADTIPTPDDSTSLTLNDGMNSRFGHHNAHY